MKSVIAGMVSEIQHGSSFSRALSLHPEVFDNLFVVTTEVGQESGRLADVLSDLADHLEAMQRLKRKVMQALVYPLLVLAVACASVLFLFVFIVPAFAEMFRTFQVELPIGTQIVLALSEWIIAFGHYAIAALVIGGLILRSAPARSVARKGAGALAAKLPFVGQIISKNMIARTCRTIGTLLRARVPLLEALTVAQRMASDRALKEEIERVLERVRHGSALAEPMFDSRLFPPMVAQMIAVGEEGSELDTMLLTVADQFQKELDAKIEILSSVIEPVLILLLGLIVGAILVSMYLPMFELVNVIGTG